MTDRNDGGGHPNSGGDTSSDRRYQALLLFGGVGADVLVIDGLLWFSSDESDLHPVGQPGVGDPLDRQVVLAL